MEAKPLDLEQWLMGKVRWLVQDTSDYLDTRELLSLCQTVALIRLNQTLERLEAGHELAGLRQALDQQTAKLADLLAGPPPPAKKPGK